MTPCEELLTDVSIRYVFQILPFYTKASETFAAQHFLVISKHRRNPAEIDRPASTCGQADRQISLQPDRGNT